MDKYIHYGHTSFDKNLFRQITNNNFFTKPDGGFWASNTKAKYGWKEWCEENDFRDCSKDNNFIFVLTNDAKILKIDLVDQLNVLPKVKSDFGISNWTMLDFEKLSESYDAIEVSIISDYRLYHELYGWDCDSILIMNPDIIVL